MKRIISLGLLIAIACTAYWLTQASPQRPEHQKSAILEITEAPARAAQSKQQLERPLLTTTVVEPLSKSRSSEYNPLNALPPIIDKFAEMDSELEEILQNFALTQLEGNIEHGAMLAIEASTMVSGQPDLKTSLHHAAGHNYEQLGYLSMAVEQYSIALTIKPNHKPSHDGMRRLDPNFSKTHPELPKPPPLRAKSTGAISGGQ